MGAIQPTVIGLVSASACLVIFLHAVCQAARVQHRITDVSLWCWALLAGGSFWSGFSALVHQPRIQQVLLNVAFAILCGSVAWKIWRNDRG